MNIKAVTVVAIRIIALYLGLTALSSILPVLGSIASFFSSGNESDALFVTAMVTTYGLFYLVGCAILWPLAPKITDCICRGSLFEPSTETELNTKNLQVAALSILGFLVLSGAIPEMVRILAAVFFPTFNSEYPMIANGMGGGKTPIIPWSDIIYLTVRLCLGVWFVLGSSGIIYFIQKVRNAGRKTI